MSADAGDCATRTSIHTGAVCANTGRTSEQGVDWAKPCTVQMLSRWINSLNGGSLSSAAVCLLLWSGRLCDNTVCLIDLLRKKDENCFDARDGIM